MTVTAPPVPDLVCKIALVTSSETSNVAASESTAGLVAEVCRTKSRTCETFRG
jgi:hypothetical protein